MSQSSRSEKGLALAALSDATLAVSCCCCCSFLNNAWPLLSCAAAAAAAATPFAPALSPAPSPAPPRSCLPRPCQQGRARAACCWQWAGRWPPLRRCGLRCRGHPGSAAPPSLPKPGQGGKQAEQAEGADCQLCPVPADRNCHRQGYKCQQGGFSWMAGIRQQPSDMQRYDPGRPWL